jgi:hypothetical protein
MTWHVATRPFLRPTCCSFEELKRNIGRMGSNLLNVSTVCWILVMFLHLKKPKRRRICHVHTYCAKSMIAVFTYNYLCCVQNVQSIKKVPLRKIIIKARYLLCR